MAASTMAPGGMYAGKSSRKGKGGKRVLSKGSEKAEEKAERGGKKSGGGSSSKMIGKPRAGAPMPGGAMPEPLY